ncbi:FAD-dependent pyridine nucleotide-disulfide oxidoreductase [Penicillium cf. griseofulvum]|uniref:FAD-dependent pyridine nucleotide-disulfide oxidoreductase n=1 Tax=Penicillium cf. griseofulvum TaxID=2972120 RepID=A0A9W9J234_9EURO|nr:FAD-dependent pyridine nucleotide-disulfide oxidoreductase [Penicillium cf. griseofulvum]KAJ5422822.1 FAD-dependent pyridine nucleotide-disulfide oxidoreductase [Penicillium cf. griseofulvum]KAJ5433961.1 FAD-dependent pyridine nucleotide-disulfide oxidoreductase [Penicillium cf. griseofulvum]
MPSNDFVRTVSRNFRVLVIGGSYGGLATALALIDLSQGRLARFNCNPDAKAPTYRIPIQITVVDKRDGYFHLIGSPKALACEKFASEAWTRFQDIPGLKHPNLSFIQGSVSSIDFKAKVAHIVDAETKSSLSEPYDYLIAGSGLRRSFPTVPQSLRRDEFLKEAREHMTHVKNARDGVVIVGGGAVGVEMAAELKILNPEQKVTLIHSRKRLLSSEPLPDEFAERVDSILRDTGVEVILGQRVIDTTAVDTKIEGRIWELTLSDGQQLKAGHVLNAVSQSIPTSTYLPKEALNEEGYVKVHRSLQFSGDIPNAEYHWAVGDITAWEGIKRCGGAMHMGHYAAMNIHQHMMAECTGGKPDYQTLQPFPSVMGLALGKMAVSYTPGEGTREGEDLRKSLFGKDMGHTICWNYMRLGEAC